MEARPHGTIPEHSHEAKMEYLWRELTAHFPFTIFFTTFGIIIAAMLTYVSMVAGTSEENTERASEMLFHAFHPIHLLFSAIATTAMFRRYDRHIIRAILIGFFGSIGVCGLSDIFMPYLTGQLLSVEHMHFHWCLIRHPMSVIPFVALGIVGGLIAADAVNRSTLYSHSMHVAVSSLASLFYLISFGMSDWVGGSTLPYVFLILVLCIIIPCCLSDIVLPLLLVSPVGHAKEEAQAGTQAEI
ncbi:MAG: hypothetical protein AB1696_00745 [Planctomycetota bacterium]